MVSKFTRIGTVTLLFLVTFAVYAAVRSHGFVDYDDDLYITENAMVLRGLSMEGLGWAFSSVGHASNWHPLTWLSHMLDVQLFGTDAGAHHLTGVFLHGLNASLLLLALHRLGLRFGVAAFVAFAFAVHPLRVESVAWASERKDLLGGLGWMTTLLAYAHYVARPSVRRMGLVVLCLSLGLLAKPMLVSLPIILILLDGWPLKRTPRVSIGKLLLEKWPLVIPVLLSCFFTIQAQASSRATRSLTELAFEDRLSNALRSTCTYVFETIWPHTLAVFHPHPAIVQGPDFRPWAPAVLLCGAAILIVSALAVARRERSGWLTTGWLWFLISLLPVIGLFQVGTQSWADRYAYLPTIGLYIILGEGARRSLERLLESKAPRQIVSAVLALLVLGTWGVQAQKHVPVWSTTRTLFQHALGVTEKNWVAHNYVGLVLLDEGQLDPALQQFEKALGIRPDDERALYNASLVQMRQGDLDGAEGRLNRALRQAPGFARAHATLGIVYGRRGDLRRAKESFREAIALDPSEAGAHANLGSVLVAEGQDEEAVRLLRRAARLDPSILSAKERLAWLLATSRESHLRAPEEALRLAQEVVRFQDDAQSLATLAAAHAANGQFEEAVRRQRSALERAPSPLKPDYAQRLASFEAGRPYENPPR